MPTERVLAGTKKKSGLELSLSVQYACKDARLPARPQLRRWVRAAQEQPLQATLRFVDADEGQALNRTYRGKDYATNVLSFVYASEPAVSGDLVICLPVVLREAAEQGKPFLAHLAHLVVHGMLHLQGYDHETGKRDAARMEAREREVLARFDIPDPYC
ncbi:MAG: rRNA maturation RNase YbeY [Gammaproteobacteria bacterium]|nr:rRNA maturation RNase YbeY [Rhodocyclaceae bacterium]MBU3909347.1 rRNA maturation RNase YbeY [Gammaproteobacteria bacterium]MBU3988705.1 rRNA maturation RNase YbeY [Gammaproteobacteria bacterium]MBU4005493.1 rRNA maturation RNase YbeY [Gammaproteobacteria bacterium]MBU4020954.1 rRNA maturation RNase YbeY [Gammaproteobacteria bacterium]